MEQNHLLEGLLSAYRHRLTLGLRLDEGHTSIIHQLIDRGTTRHGLSSTLVRGIGQHGLVEFAADLAAERTHLQSSERWEVEMLSDLDEALFHLGHRYVLPEARQVLSRELESPALTKGRITRYVRTLQYIGEREDLELLVRLLPHPAGFQNWILTALRSIGWRTLRVRLMLALGIPDEEVNSYLANLTLGPSPYFPNGTTADGDLAPLFRTEVGCKLRECSSPDLVRRVLALLAMPALPQARQFHHEEMLALATERPFPEPADHYARESLAFALRYPPP